MFCWYIVGEVLVKLHVDLSKEEHEKLSKLRGTMKWRPWLLTIEKQLSAMADRVEWQKNRADQLEQDNNDLRMALKKCQQQGE